MRSEKRFALGLLVLCVTFVCACSTAYGPSAKPKAVLEVIPPETFLSPALIQKPVSFRGSGFQPNEMVTVEMVVPAGLEIKGVNKDEGAVGLAYANADKEGNFVAAMGPTATLNWFFQVGWTPLLKPDFKEAKPIPPGVYQINATGMDSGTVATAALKIVPPPPSPPKQ